MASPTHSRPPAGSAPGPGQSWAAPLASGPLQAMVRLPGSKSLTNRELVLSALADGQSVLRAPLRSRDTELMIAALRALGARIEELSAEGGSPAALRISPDGPVAAGEVDCGLAGTVMRFVPPVAALAEGETRFDGDPEARRRPMGAMLAALRELGIDVAGDGLPFTVRGRGGVVGGPLTIDASLSSQFVSGLLLSAARFEAGLVLAHSGERLPSLPHIEMTLDCLRARGVDASAALEGTPLWTVQPGRIAGATVDIEPDLSNAGPFLAAALVAGGSVTIPGWPQRTTQVGAQLEELLPLFGARCERTAEGGVPALTVSGPGVAGIEGVELDLGHAGELAPTLIALAALARTPSRITGIGHIRHHETDRIAALARELSALGAEVTELEDGIQLRPARLHGGLWHSYADHRMATSGALIGLAVPGVLVEDVATTAKTLPDFTGLWEGMLALHGEGGAA